MMQTHGALAWLIYFCVGLGARDLGVFVYKLLYVIVFVIKDAIWRRRHRTEIAAVQYLTGIEAWVRNRKRDT